MEMRKEQDSMGDVLIPADAYYGAQTRRAMDNFPISGQPFPWPFIVNLALVKQCAARVNADLGTVSRDISRAIIKAAGEIREGRYRDQFPVDIFQTGSGTSTNMNMNEVLASRANEILSGRRGGKSPVHPNDHVNAGQSSNDVIPTVLHMSGLLLLRESLIPALKDLNRELAAKAEQFAHIPKIGRTHLQDALPMTLGQEFSGYAGQIDHDISRLQSVVPRLAELALGGTAVGTGQNAPPGFAVRVIDLIAAETGQPFCETTNHFEAQASQDTALETSGLLKTTATSLFKIANDIRWLSSGPRCGLGEITLPALQPGSSMMPGKVNPVIAESVMQVAAQVTGNDAALTLAAQSGNFELITMLPVIAANLLQSIELLASVIRVFTDKCLKGITPNEAACTAYVERSLALATAFIPQIGYDAAAGLAGRAYRAGRTIRQQAREENILPDELLRSLLPDEKDPTV